MTDFQKIYDAALEAGTKAGQAVLDETGDHSCCGYAVVAVPTGKYRKLAKFLNDHPSINPTRATSWGRTALWLRSSNGLGVQSLHIHEAAARAAVEVFRKAGFPEVHVHSWVD